MPYKKHRRSSKKRSFKRFSRKRVAYSKPRRMSSRRPVKRRRALMPVPKGARPTRRKLAAKMTSKRDCVIVKHREYVQDVTSTTGAFSLVQLPINPGIVGTFPWLSAIAENFTEYRMTACEFQYVSLASDVTSVVNQGYVCGTVEYNPTLPNFTSKSQMENNLGSNSGKPTSHLAFPVDCKGSGIGRLGDLYLRTGPLTNIPNAQNIQFYDLGEFNLAVGANATNSVVMGELWVSYDVCLMKPQILLNDVPLYAHWQSPSNTPTNANPLTGAVALSDNIGITTNATTGVITFPSSAFAQGHPLYVNLFWTGNSTACAAPSFNRANVADFKIFDGSPGVDFLTAVTGTITTASYSCIIYPSATGLVPTITVGAAGTFPAVSTFDMFVTQLPLSSSVL